jgi:GH35 family endo-1,4-beta-xylanase
VLKAALDSGVCNDFLLETIVDKLSGWEPGNSPLPGTFADNDPTPYDDNFQPKPAYYAMSSVLQKAVDAKFRYRLSVPFLSADH